jgi:hypothetical protein
VKHDPYAGYACIRAETGVLQTPFHAGENISGLLIAVVDWKSVEP